MPISAGQEPHKSTDKIQISSSSQNRFKPTLESFPLQAASEELVLSTNNNKNLANKMPEYVPVKGFSEMENLLKLHDKKKEPIYIYFYGEKDKQGRSWCIDCVEAEETIMTAFRQSAPAECLILVVDVGNREVWLNKENSFRNPPFSVSGIPALMHWRGVERLDSDQLKKSTLLELFFEETGNQKSAAP